MIHMKSKNDTTPKLSYKTIFRQKEFMKITLAGVINRFGDSIDAIAFTWLVYALTGNATWSALMFAANQLPSVLVQPFAGALVEGMEKKKLMVVTDVIRGVITVGLAVLYITNLLNPWIMLAFTLVNSSVEAFRLPASLAVMPKVLEEKYYAHGTSLSSTINRIVELVGLGLAGVLIGALGIGSAIAIDGISFFASAFVLNFLRIREDNLRKEKLTRKNYTKTLRDGLSYLKGQPIIRNFCLLSVLINTVIVPLNALQTPLIQEVLGQGSELLSAFSLALTIGMGIGSFIYPHIGPLISVRRQFTGCGIFIGICMYCYTLGTGFTSYVYAIYALTITVSFVLGMSVSIMVAALQVQFMKTVNQEYLARVGSIFNAGASAASPVTSLAVSAVAAFFSVSQIFKLCALICVIIFMIMALVKVRLE